jgi:hypothetical protein
MFMIVRRGFPTVCIVIRLVMTQRDKQPHKQPPLQLSRKPRAAMELLFCLLHRKHYCSSIAAPLQPPSSPIGSMSELC